MSLTWLYWVGLVTGGVLEEEIKKIEAIYKAQRARCVLCALF